MIFAELKLQDAYRNKAGVALTPLEVRDLVVKLGLIKEQPAPRPRQEIAFPIK